jgi:hypothetical protein
MPANVMTKLQRRILAILEESGEYYITALTNAVGLQRGNDPEIEAMADALSGLVRLRYVTLGTTRDEVLRCWISMPADEALSILQSLTSFVEWISEENYWSYREGVDAVSVLITDAGLVIARQILAEEGWPQGPFENL